jgi:hypothetical protein
MAIEPDSLAGAESLVKVVYEKMCGEHCRGPAALKAALERINRHEPGFSNRWDVQLTTWDDKTLVRTPYIRIQVTARSAIDRLARVERPEP